MKKYKSEAHILPGVGLKKQADNTPIWLETDRKSVNNSSSALLKKDVEQNTKPFMSKRGNPAEEAKVI